MKHEGVATSQLMSAVMKAREAYARDLFDIERVRLLMWKEADAGHEFLQVMQEKPLRLQSTRAAMKLIAWLAREGAQRVVLMTFHGSPLHALALGHNALFHDVQDRSEDE